MYEDLAKRLRDVAGGGREEKCDSCPYAEEYPCCVDCLEKLHKQAADAIEELSMKLHGDEAAIAGMKREIERMVVADKPRWISVQERLPEENTRVIGFMAWKGITAIEYQHGKWYSIDHLQPLPDEAVTHWMQLPTPPKEAAT